MSVSLAAAHSVVLSLPFRTFRNAICILRSLELHELLAAGVIKDRAEWDAFQKNEAKFFIKLSDERAAALWALIQDQQPPALRAEVAAL